MKRAYWPKYPCPLNPITEALKRIGRVMNSGYKNGADGPCNRDLQSDKYRIIGVARLIKISRNNGPNRPITRVRNQLGCPNGPTGPSTHVH